VRAKIQQGNANFQNPPPVFNVIKVELVSTPSDESLLTAYVAGESDRFELLVRRHSQELYQFLVRFTGNAAVAEDVVQETFLQVHLSAATFDPSRRFRPWLFTIGANKARDMMRSKARRPEIALDDFVGSDREDGQRFSELISDDAPSPSEPLEVEEENKIVRGLVETMPEHLREVLVLGYFHRFPYKEMADILGIPLGTVKSRLHAAVAHFGQCYRTELDRRKRRNKIA